MNILSILRRSGGRLRAGLGGGRAAGGAGAAGARGARSRRDGDVPYELGTGHSEHDGQTEENS